MEQRARYSRGGNPLMARLDKTWTRFGLAAALALAAVAGCKSTASPPGSFGINITVDAHALKPDQLTAAVNGSLLVTGADTESVQFNDMSAITSGELRFRYIPKATTGTLDLEFDALDATGVLIGSGKTTGVVISSGATAATITLTAATGSLKGTGTTCNADGQCASGFCTDGVCCAERCNDQCSSCGLTNSKGICTAYAAGTDPENECAGQTTGSDGGTHADAGTKTGATDAGAHADGGSPDAETINVPDGGVVAMPAACGGKCDGTRHCGAFAKSGTSCGKEFCNTRRDLAILQCDGNGNCGVGLSACTDGYVCDFTSAACRTNCAANADCQATSYCNGNGMCAPQKADGLTCATDAECTNGHCAIASNGGANVCCNTACDSPNSCNTGTVGKCACPGVSCATGVACQIFYADSDVDGYGDKTGTLAAGTAKAGCAGTPPVGFVADNTDCDDKDANVHPGQTGWFGTVSLGTHTFDYDCDGTAEMEFNQYPGASCTFCPAACGTGGCGAATSSTCASASAQASLACNQTGICLTTPILTEAVSEVEIAATIITTPPITRLITACGANDHGGYTQSAAVTCGQTANYTTCGTCAASGGTMVAAMAARQQLCH